MRKRKLYKLIIAVIIFFVDRAISHDSVLPAGTPVQVTIVFNNRVGNQQQGAPVVYTDTRLSLSPDGGTDKSSLSPGVISFLTDCVAKKEAFMRRTGTFLNSKFVGCGLLLGSYGLLFLMQMRYALALDSKNSWGRWRYTLPLEELCQLSPPQLHQELIATLHRKYGQKKAPSFSWKMLYQAQQEMAHELKFLYNFLRFYKFCHVSRLYWLLPNQENLYLEAQHQVKRVEFLMRVIETMGTLLSSSSDASLVSKSNNLGYSEPSLAE